MGVGAVVDKAEIHSYVFANAPVVRSHSRNPYKRYGCMLLKCDAEEGRHSGGNPNDGAVAGGGGKGKKGKGKKGKGKVNYYEDQWGQ